MYEDRVARGAALLDRVRPGWAAEIACDRLAMESCGDCIMGQIYGSYWTGCRQVARSLPQTFLFAASDHGFTLTDDEQNCVSETLDDVLDNFSVLADAWRAAIRERTEGVLTNAK